MIKDNYYKWQLFPRVRADIIMFGCRITVPEYGFLHLELIPMLVGFFTYKIATFFQAVEEAVSIVEKKDPDIV